MPAIHGTTSRTITPGAVPIAEAKMKFFGNDWNLSQRTIPVRRAAYLSTRELRNAVRPDIKQRFSSFLLDEGESWSRLTATECECPSLSISVTALWRAQPFTEIRLALSYKVPLIVHDFRSCI
jgi:hypothetical protein